MPLVASGMNEEHHVGEVVVVVDDVPDELESARPGSNAACFMEWLDIAPAYVR